MRGEAWRNPIAWTVVLALVLLVGWLGTRGLNEPDEARFAAIAREMAQGGDVLIPHLNGVPHFQKPPMTYWITAGLIRLLGPHEWAVRLTSALAAFGALLFTMHLAGALFGAGCRWKAGLILMVSAGFFLGARLLTTDMLLTFFITASVTGLVRYAQGGRIPWLAVFYLGMGFGFLTKGPIGILLPAAAGIGLQAGRRRLGRPPVPLYWGLGLTVALLVGLSWFVAVIASDRTLADYFFRHELIDRVATDVHRRAKPAWFYPAAFAIGLLPWSGYAAVGARDLWRRRRALAPETVGLFAGWIAAPAVVFLLVVSKMATYLLPLLPPTAILLARWFEHPETDERWRRPARITVRTVWAALLGLTVTVLATGGPLPGGGVCPSGAWWVLAGACLAFLALDRAVGKGLSRDLFLLWKGAAWGAVALLLAARSDAWFSASGSTLRDIAAVIRRIDPEGRIPILAYKTRAHGLEFYLGRYVSRARDRSDVVLPPDPETARRIVADENEAREALSARPAFLVTRESHHGREAELTAWRRLATDGPWILMGSPALRVPNRPPSGDEPDRRRTENESAE